MTREEVMKIVAKAHDKGERPDLRDANLFGADLYEADLRDANLRDANLGNADLRGADLRGADLRGANLSWANLTGGDLRDADLYGADLTGAKGILRVGPGGSRDDELYAVRHDSGPMIMIGCRWCDLDGFLDAVEKDHGDDRYGVYYRAVADLIRVWYGLEESEA